MAMRSVRMAYGADLSKIVLDGCSLQCAKACLARHLKIVQEVQQRDRIGAARQCHNPYDIRMGDEVGIEVILLRKR